jgi:hypothetical protein
MDISHQLERDHGELHALSSAMLRDDGGERDNLFSYLDLRTRRHLAVIEDVLVHPIRRGEHSEAAGDVLKEHKALRGHLSGLRRPDKASAEWAGDFGNFTDHLGRICHRHESLAQLSRASGEDLGRRYEEAMLARIPGHLSWNQVGLGLAGAILLAGAAYAATRYFRSGSRRKNSHS